MTKEKWLKHFDESKDKFKWFWILYKKDWDKLMELRQEKNITGMLTLMNQVWFSLPDDKFNIMYKPKGWMEFISLLEDDVN